MKSFVLCIFILSLLFCKGHSQSKKWFGKRITNTQIYLDPLEPQIQGSMVRFPQETNNYLYIPFTIGGTTSIVSKAKTETDKWEIAGGLAVFTQFEWKTVAGEWQRNLINADYKASLMFNRTMNSHTFRVRLFHISSHLGDDYIIRNAIRFYIPNPVNYEQLDVTWFEQLNKSIRWYGNIGSVVRPGSIRKPLSFQSGFLIDKQLANRALGFSGALDVKVYQQNQFTPNWRLAAGPSWFLADRLPMRVLAEFYTGHLPYSVYESKRVQWFGIGTCFVL